MHVGKHLLLSNFQVVWVEIGVNIYEEKKRLSGIGFGGKYFCFAVKYIPNTKTKNCTLSTSKVAANINDWLINIGFIRYGDQFKFQYCTFDLFDLIV